VTCVAGITAAGGVVATGYKIYQQWHQVDKRTEVLSSFRDKLNKYSDKVNKRFDNVDKRFDNVDKRFDKLDKKLDKVLELLDASNKQHMTTR